MKTMTYTSLRSSLADAMDTVCDDAAPLIITRKEQQVVMLSKDEYDSLVETAHLLSSPENARRLFDAVEEIKRGDLTEQELVDA